MRGEIWENCIDWCFKCDLDITENRTLNERFELLRPVPYCPQCGRAMGFIPKQGILEYLKTLDPEEREAREKGIWKHLSGLIYKTLSRDDHLYDDFPIPRHWMKIEGIDPHDARPSKYLFAAVSPEDIEIFKNIRNRVYVFDYINLDKDMDTIARQIKMKREEHGYTEPRWIVMDAKYGVRTEMEGKSWQRELQKRNIGNIILSQSKPGDVELGHKLVREYLKFHYSVVNAAARPGIVFAKNKCAGRNGPIHQMFNYQYDEKHDRPKEQFKDYPDIIRYMALEEPIYVSPSEERARVRMLKQRYEDAVKKRRAVG